MRLVHRVRIIGPSMEPYLRNGDWWLAIPVPSYRVGHVVLFRHPLRPDLTVVKRLTERMDSGWWVTGDNPVESDDSRVLGAIPDSHLLARLVFRYRPLIRG
jgi:nickel-type superoxide dismutase maturation protease